MDESSLPAGAESNIFDQFDVRVAGECLPGGAPTFDGYFCRLPACRGEKRVFSNRRSLLMHRVHGHSLPHKGTYKLPEEDQIREWLHRGKQRPYEISPERTKSPDGSPRSSLLSKLLHCKPDTESELQPSSLESNIFEQFNVRHVPGEAGAPPYVGYVCLLSQCHEKKVCFNTYTKWIKHRRRVHNETDEAQSVTLPSVCQIREWVIVNKTRPYEVSRGRKAYKKMKFCLVDPDVFAEFDVKGTVEDGEQLQFICLLGICKELDVSFQGGRCWRKHRVKDHTSPKYKGGEFALPSERTIKDWMNAGKPLHYKPLRRVRRSISLDPPSKTAKRSTELDNREVDPTPSNVGSQNLHKLLSPEGRSSLRKSKSLARLGKLTPSTPPDEIPKKSRRRPRNADAEPEPAHQKQKRRSIHRTIRTRSTAGAIPDSDSSDLVALKVEAHGEDPSGNLCKQSMEETNPPLEEKPSSDDSDEECDEGTEDVDEETDDGTENVDDHNRNSADMEEFGEEPHEDSTQSEDALPPLPYSQPELHDSGAAEVAEVDEDDHEEFEALDNVLPLRPEMQNMKVVEHSSVQPQDFQGVTDEHQQNSTAEMADADEDAPKDSVASENVLPSLQNSSVEDKPDCEVIPAEMAEVEEEELEDSVAPENALTALAYSRPNVWELSSVQPQDFKGDVLETLPNPTAEMDEVEEAPEDSVAIESVLPSPSCLQLEFGVTKIVEDDNVLPQEFLPNTPAEKAELSEKAAEEIGDVENLSLSVQSKSSEQNALSPLGHGNFREASQSSPEDSPGETGNYRPNSNAEMAEVGKKAPQGFVAPGNFMPQIPSMQSEGTKVPSLEGPTDIQAAPIQEFAPRLKMDQVFIFKAHAAGMGQVGKEAPQGFVAPENFPPRIPLMESEGNKLPSLEGPTDIQAAPIQESVPRYHMDQVFISAPNAAGMGEVGGEAPQGFEAPENLPPCILLMQSEGTKLPSLEDPIDIQTATVQEFVPRFRMDPVFPEEPSAARLSEVRLEEAHGFFGAPGNLLNFFPSNAPEETSKQLFLSSLEAKASSPDYSNIGNEPITNQFLWNADIVHTDIESFMNELAAAVPFTPSTEAEGLREVRRIYMDGKEENSRERENQVDPLQEPRQEFNTLMDWEAFESEPDLPLMDDPVIEDPQVFYRLQAQAVALALSPQPTQQFFNPESSESSSIQSSSCSCSTD